MDEKKNVQTFGGAPGEVFQLWSAKTEAALAAREGLELVEDEKLSGEVEPPAEEGEQVDNARAIIIRARGIEHRDYV